MNGSYHVTLCLLELRSDESLKSGNSSLNSVYLGNDRKGWGDSAGRPSTMAAAVSTRRSSVTSIKSFTAILPAVLETVESEPNSSNSASAISIKIRSSSEATVEGKDKNMNDNEVEIEMNSAKYSKIRSENEIKDNNSIESDNTESAEQKSSDTKHNSTPDIQIDPCTADPCTDVTRPFGVTYKRRMSKSCDQIDIKPNDSNTKWNSWSNLISAISNTVSRVRLSLSNGSIGHADNEVDVQSETIPEEAQFADNQSDKTLDSQSETTPEEMLDNQGRNTPELVDNQSERTPEKAKTELD